MKPPAAQSSKEGRRSSTSSAARNSSGSGVKRRSSGGGGERLGAAAAGGGGGAGALAVALPSPPPFHPSEARAVLSGSLFRCSPIFSTSSDTVFCACSSSVLGVSVETGEQLLRLEGHTKDVTAMLRMPPGVYGVGAGPGTSPATRSDERILTSSLDGTLRLWDVSADVMSLEGEAERCLRVFSVGMPVYHLFLGRQDSSGAALDVIMVTKEGTSYLHGYEDARSDKPAQMERAIGAAKSPSPPSNTFLDNMDEDDDDDEDLTSEEDDDSSDDDDDDGVVFEASGIKAGGKPASSSRGGGDTEGGVLVKGQNMKRRGGSGGRIDHRKRGGRVKGNQRLFDWQAVRYGLAKGVAQAILLVSRQQFCWIGAAAPRSPITTDGKGSSKKRGRRPVILSAEGRVVTAVDAKSGDKAVLVTAVAPVRSMAVGGDGETLVTGHLDGSMSQWHGLTDRLGAAFRVSGFDETVAEPSTDMHWHAHPVRCMAIAPDGVQLFSGGEEAVLVQWNLDKGTKAFIPRLGAPLQGLAVSPGQEYAVATTRDNAVTLVGLAGWDVMWQMRGLTLSRSPPSFSLRPSPAERAVRARQALKLSVGPRRGLVACNGRAGHVQFYNVATDCLEASTEVVRFNKDTSAKSWQSDQLAKRGKTDAVGDGATGGPVVEHVAFSPDGKRMVAVASRTLRHASASPSLSFWKHARGSDPFGSDRGYTGSYTGARNPRGGMRGGGGGTTGHWAADTSVENPHGPGCEVAAMEYHPREDVVVTAGKQDGGFNLWGLRRSQNAIESLAAAATRGSGGRGGGGSNGGEKQPVHWACSLSVQYKEGLAATGVSFCSDGSVLAVAYTPKDESEVMKGKKQHHHSSGQGVITLWSLETVTLLSTLLPPRTRDVRLSPSSMKCLGFMAGSGRVFAAGNGYAAVWDMLSPEPTPLWEYRARVLAAAATADTGSFSRSGKSGISVKGRGVGDVALCVDAASLGGKSSRERGSVVLLLNSGDPTPLHSWRLPSDMPTSLRLLVDGGGGREGVLCLTQRGELLLLSVVPPSAAAGDGATSVPRPQKQQQQQSTSGLGVIRIKHGATAPALHVSAASKRALLAVDLAASDPALTPRDGKRFRVSTDGEDEEEDDDGHAGGREAVVRSRRRASDVLDPSTVNLAPVPDMYTAFMRTLIKPAPQQQQQQQQSIASGALLAAAGPTLAGGGIGKASKGRKGKRAGERAPGCPPSVMEEKLLAVFAKKLKA